MAKRTRGSRRDRRRGRPIAAPVPRPTLRLAPAGEVLDETGEAVTAGPARTMPSSAPHAPTTVRPAGGLSAKAADEYRYVSLDLRRIVVVLGGLFGAILGLWVAVDLLRVVTI